MATQIFSEFSPRSLGKWSNLTNIFQMGWNHQLDGIPEADVLVASFFCLQTFDHGLHVVYFFSYAGYDDNVQWMLQPFATTKNGVFGESPSSSDMGCDPLSSDPNSGLIAGYRTVRRLYYPIPGRLAMNHSEDPQKAISIPEWHEAFWTLLTSTSLDLGANFCDFSNFPLTWWPENRTLFGGCDTRNL